MDGTAGSGAGRTWCEKSASMMITKSPMTKLSPWMYAVLRNVRPCVRKRHDQSISTYPRPSLPARRCRTCRNVQCALSTGGGGGAGAGVAHDFVLAVHVRELGGNVLCAVQAVIVDDNDLPRQITVFIAPQRELSSACLGNS